MKCGKQAKIAMFSVISRKGRKVRQGAGGKRKGDGRPRPPMGRMESARIATLRLMMAQEKGILPTERLATVAAQTQQETQTDLELKQS